jgi:hypothetical protein
MDPTAAWQTIVAGMQALACDPTDVHTREEVIWALQGLATWLDRGGAPAILAATPPGTAQAP